MYLQQLEAPKVNYELLKKIKNNMGKMFRENRSIARSLDRSVARLIDRLIDRSLDRSLDRSID